MFAVVFSLFTDGFLDTSGETVSDLFLSPGKYLGGFGGLGMGGLSGGFCMVLIS